LKKLEDLALDTRARREEVERAKDADVSREGVKLAQLVRYCSSSAEAVTMAWSVAPLPRGCPSMASPFSFQLSGFGCGALWPKNLVWRLRRHSKSGLRRWLPGEGEHSVREKAWQSIFELR